MFLFPLTGSVNNQRTLGIIDRSVEENNQLMETTSTISLFSDSNTKINFFSKEIPLQKSEINTYYLLAGSGAVIFMLLIIIVIQTIKKSKSAKTAHQACDETFKRPPNDNNKKYLNITSSKQSSHFIQRMDSVYQEIDESVELMPIPVSTDTSNELRDRGLSKCIHNSVSNATEHDDINAQMSELYVLPSTESAYPDTDNVDYLQPVFIHANIEIESKRGASFVC